MTEAVSVKVCGCEGSCEGVWLWKKLWQVCQGIQQAQMMCTHLG